MNFSPLETLRAKGIISYFCIFNLFIFRPSKKELILPMEESFHHRECYPAHLQSILQSTRDSVESVKDTDNSTTHKYKVKTKHISHPVPKWNAELACLRVQSKFKHIVTFESDCPIRNWILCGLPIGHLSFPLRARSDTLPASFNLTWWTIQAISNFWCAYCNSIRSTVTHILNGCLTALNQGRYTWWHDSLLWSIVASISSNFTPRHTHTHTLTVIYVATSDFQIELLSRLLLTGIHLQK